MRRVLEDNRLIRIKSRLKQISMLYQLAFNVDGANTNLQKLKKDLNFANDEKELINCCGEIAKAIACLRLMQNNESIKDVCLKIENNLKQVFIQMRDLIKDEFRTIRNRNNRLPELEQYL